MNTRRFCCTSGIGVFSHKIWEAGIPAYFAALAGVLDLLLLHGASGLLLDHDTDGIEVLVQGYALHFRRDIGGVVLGQVETDVELLGVEFLDVLWVTPVVEFALAGIAWLHMDGSFGFV